MIFEFYSLMLMIMFCIADFSWLKEKDRPLLLAYCPNDQIFTSIDPITILNTVNPEYTKIIGFCPISSLPTFSSLSVIEKVWTPDAYDKSLRNFKCYSTVHFITMKLTSQNYYRVGYPVFLDLNFSSEYKMETGNLSAADDYAGKRIFFFELFRFHYHTTYLENAGSEHRIVIYRRDKNKQQPTKCQEEDMKLEDDVNIPADIDEKTFQKLYRHKNQGDVKSMFNWPDSIAQEVVEQYFIMHKMVPMNDFTEKVSRLSTCSYFNTVPLWGSVSQGRMKRVELYIQTVAGLLPHNTLLIGTIPIDVLKANKKSKLARLKEAELKEIYLDMKNENIPVPKLIVKLIIYRAPWLNGGKTGERGFYSKKDEYAIAIVIHNELGNAFEKVCGSNLGENACTKYGWFVSDNEKDKGVYCCEINDKFFTYKFNDIHLESPTVFDLNNVLWTRGEGKIEDEFRNIAEDIQKQN